jgi:hypothetical protein
MQAAARKVLEENQRVAKENVQLRALLVQAGYSEAQINGSVSRGVDTTDSATPLASPTFDKSMLLAKEGLEKLLAPRNCTCGAVSQNEDSVATATASPTGTQIQSPLPMVPPQQLQQTNSLPISIGVSTLLSPTSQSYPSSSVSSPNSGYDVSDDYSLSSPELTATVGQSVPRARIVQPQQDLYQLAGAFSFQMDFEPQPTSWPRLSTQHQAVSPQPSIAPTSSPALSGVDGSNSYSPATHAYGVNSMGQVVMSDGKTAEQEMIGYPAMNTNYSEQMGQQGQQGWQ